jgi:hypothetical protein
VSSIWGTCHHSDEKLLSLFERLTYQVPYRIDTKKGDGKFVKSRCVDPLCEYEGSIKRISEIDSGWAKIIEQELKPKKYHLVFEE